MAAVKVRAFTLIEMLVVIGIIAILAGIVLGVLPGVQHKNIRSRVNTELKGLESAIESYKAKHAFYPPDNPKDASRPPLFYELTGTTNGIGGGGQPEYRSKFAAHDPPLNPTHLAQIFGIDGFINNAPAEEGSEVKNFYENLRERQVRQIPASGTLPPYRLLVAPRQGMDRQPAVWHYNKSNPTNNVGAFDLWAEIEIGGEKIVIGNWEK